METYKKLQQAVLDAEQDVLKATSGTGNKAAGTRTRQNMQRIKELAQSIREQILLARTGAAVGTGQEPEQAAQQTTV